MDNEGVFDGSLRFDRKINFLSHTKEKNHDTYQQQVRS